MELMSSDLYKTLKGQKLTNDQIQFQIYQILRALKVSCSRHTTPDPPCLKIIFFCFISLQYVHSAGIIHRVSLSFTHIYSTFVVVVVVVVVVECLMYI